MSRRAYDDVFDSARDFRVLLSAMARPGALHDFGEGAWAAPPGFSPASTAIALALLNPDTRFSAVGLPDSAAAFVTARTRCLESPVPDADFLFFASAAGNEEKLALAKRGSLEYPDQGATAIAQVESLSAAPAGDAVAIRATGPGIDGTAVFYAQGVQPVWLATLRAGNAEFPLGVDAIFTCGSRLVCLPRSASFEWE